MAFPPAAPAPKLFPLQCLHGLHVFPYPNDDSPTLFSFALSIAHSLSLSTAAISVNIERHMPHLKQHIVRPAAAAAAAAASGSDAAAGGLGKSAEAIQQFQKLKLTYVAVKTAVSGVVEAQNAAKLELLNLYPLVVVEALLQHYASKKAARVNLATLEAVKLLRARSPADQPGALLSAPSAAAAAVSGELQASLHESKLHESKEPEIKVKIEPTVAMSLEDDGDGDLPRIREYLHGVPVIDLTRPRTIVELIDREDDGVLATLIDNFLEWRSPAAHEEVEWMRHYSLKPSEVSETLAVQCQRFSAFRQVRNAYASAYASACACTGDLEFPSRFAWLCEKQDRQQQHSRFPLVRWVRLLPFQEQSARRKAEGQRV